VSRPAGAWHRSVGSAPLRDRLDPATVAICGDLIVVLGAGDEARTRRIGELVAAVLEEQSPPLDAETANAWFLENLTSRIVAENLSSHLIREFWEIVHELRVSPGPH
jgi:hypothetical protein